MPRPITLFTGQWADLPLETLAKKTSAWGFDGLELACWGDHFDVDKALEKDAYLKEKRNLLAKYNLKCFAISTHLVGQCVCDDPSTIATRAFFRLSCGATASPREFASAAPRK